MVAAAPCPLLSRVPAHGPRRDPADEREEIRALVSELPAVESAIRFNDKVGRIPAGPARGWRGRKAKSCDQCEGDLWVELDDGTSVPCKCRNRRAAKRASNRLRAGNWWHGTSLSFAAPPLASVPSLTRDAVEGLCGEVRHGGNPRGLWVVGDSDTGKSALCAYIAQRLYPSNDAIAECTGDLVAHLRWLGAVKGELAVEKRMEKLVDTPLLVLDDLDRPIRTYPPAAMLGLRESCASQDLVRLATLIRDRQAAMRPTVITSRVQPKDCANRLASITPHDLMRGLLTTASGEISPFEDFPEYLNGLLDGAIRDMHSTCETCELDEDQSAVAAA
jgi:DNA replication protein DnaC